MIGIYDAESCRAIVVFTSDDYRVATADVEYPDIKHDLQLKFGEQTLELGRLLRIPNWNPLPHNWPTVSIDDCHGQIKRKTDLYVVRKQRSGKPDNLAADCLKKLASDGAISKVNYDPCDSATDRWLRRADFARRLESNNGRA